MARLIRVRRSCPEIGSGRTVVLDTGDPAVLAHVCIGQGRSVLALHNLAERKRRVEPRFGELAFERLIDLAGDQRYPPPAEGRIEPGAYGYRWFRMEGATL